MTLPGHKLPAGRQLDAVDECRGRILRDEHVMKPVLQDSTQTRIVDLQQIQERLQSIEHISGCRHSDSIRRKQCQLCRRCIAKKGFRPIQVRHFKR